MLTVHRTPTGKNFVFATNLHTKLHLINGIAGTNLIRQPDRQIQRGRRPVVHEIYIFAKRRFIGILHIKEFGSILNWALV